MTQGQWLASPDGHRWWFDSGSIALDFVHAEPFGTPSALQVWLQARFPVDASANDRELADALALRASISSIASAIANSEPAAADDVDVLNLFAATPDIPPVLDGGRRQAGRTNARLGQALSAIAREAVGLFSSEARGRIRECAADDCAIVFYDESRSNNRRWCSMQRCGNRAKVRKHRSVTRRP